MSKKYRASYRTIRKILAAHEPKLTFIPEIKPLWKSVNIVLRESQKFHQIKRKHIDLAISLTTGDTKLTEHRLHLFHHPEVLSKSATSMDKFLARLGHAFLNN